MLSAGRPEPRFVAGTQTVECISTAAPRASGTASASVIGERSGQDAHADPSTRTYDSVRVPKLCGFEVFRSHHREPHWIPDGNTNDLSTYLLCAQV